jgi:phosphoribosylformylglycinamidine synthase
MKPRALILHATGSNRDLDLQEALELAGAEAEVVHINQLRWGERKWQDYQLLALPGGFSYADALGAGKLFALDLSVYFADEVRAFIAQGKPVIGICNGFQALVKAGLLPGGEKPPRATLTINTGGRFECRWVRLKAISPRCIWTRGLQETIYCPVAHGEGTFVLPEAGSLEILQSQGQAALVYVFEDGSPADGAYPHNPNGSMGDLAGICNPQGNVLGLMPHPENHIHASQHPRCSRGEREGSGLALFINGVRYAGQV